MNMEIIAESDRKKSGNWQKLTTILYLGKLNKDKEFAVPTRNINLTDRYDEFVHSQIKGGRFKNASEVVRAALHLLEQQEKEYALKLEALREAVAEGVRDYENGNYTTFESRKDIDQFFSELDNE